MSALERIAGREMLDAEPLKAAILRDAERALIDAPPDRIGGAKGYYILADRIGIHGDILTRILGQRHVGLDLADRYCCATGRLLRDLYPEVYDEQVESITWPCKRCRIEVDMDLISESPRRMHLRCRDCGRGHHVERYKRGAPAHGYQPFPVSTETIIAEYQAGASGLEIARRHGFKNEDSVYTRLRKAGVPRRHRVTPQGIETGTANLAAYRERHTREAGERAQRIEALWNAGLPAKTIAEEFGVSVTTVKAWRASLGLRCRLPGGRGWA